MASYKRFEELPVWQNARELAKASHDLITNTPIAKNYKLRDQMYGSSGSVMDNIAEGFEREGNNEFVNFLSYAKGSSGELRSQLYRAFDCEFISKLEMEKHIRMTELVSSEINGFMNYLRNSNIRGNKFKR